MKIFPTPQQIPAPVSAPAVDPLDQAVETSLRMALNYHQCGEVDHAETLYRGILEVQPQHPEANYQLGRMAVQLSEAQAGLPHFAIALEARKDDERYWLGYIDAMAQANEMEAAQQLLALGRQHGLQGDNVEALSKELQQYIVLSNQNTQPSVSVAHAPTAARSSRKQGQTKPTSLSKVIRKPAPVSRDLRKLAGLFAQGRFPESEALASSLVKSLPRHGFYWKVLGTAIQLQGRHEQALLPLQTAAALWPEDAQTHCNLGLVLKDLGRFVEAEASYRRALELAPADADLNNNLGVMRRAQGRFVEAEIHYRRALQSNPTFVRAYSNLSNVLQDLGRFAEAEASCRRALEIDPTYDEGYNNLGALQHAQDQLPAAESSFRQALEINPANGEAHKNLGTLLQQEGRLTEAEACYRRALPLLPDDALSRSGLLFCLSHNEAVSASDLFVEHCRFGERVEATLSRHWQAHSNLRDPERCLQIGFVSGDLRGHPVASYIEPILKLLSSHADLSVHTYFNHPKEDAYSQRLRTHVRHWHTISNLTDADLADKFRSDRIDILIDLSGHTGLHRLLCFARKPAPVQVSWIGYPGTTGLKSMDYYLSDRFFTPLEQFESQFIEKLVYLPALAPFQRSSDAPPVNELPALTKGFITFGSFNRRNKLSRAVIALWAQLLRAVPTSRMLLGGLPEQGQYQTLIDWFADEGITPQRLDFRSRASMGDYLLLHHQVDICLDAFPYNGSTTSLHALSMGVPTLTMDGTTPAGRAGAWILGHVGLSEFVVPDAREFVRTGLIWADRLPELARLRAGLRERFEDSALGQPALIAAGLERALRIMWQRWCAGLSAASFEVSRSDIEQTTQEVGQ